MRRLPRMLLCCLLTALAWGPAAPPAHGETVLKLATLVPEGSVWDRILRQMGSDWAEATDGRVRLRLYPGGVAGDEPDVLRKMRIGQLHAGTFTVAGLSEVDDAFNLFEIPFFFRSYDELFYVLEKMTPYFAQRLEENGYVLIHWGNGGWVHFFTAKRAASVEEMRKLKIFVWAGNDHASQWWKSRGFQPIPLAYTDILTGLQTGMIEAAPTTPLAALSLQWFRLTPYMPDMGLAPLAGATVVSKRAWNRISEADRAHLLAIARETGARLQEEIPEQDRRAVEEMVKRGLTVVPVEGTEHEAAWRQVAEAFAASMRGSTVPEETYELALGHLEEYRRGHGGGSP